MGLSPVKDNILLHDRYGSRVVSILNQLESIKRDGSEVEHKLFEVARIALESLASRDNSLRINELHGATVDLLMVAEKDLLEKRTWQIKQAMKAQKE